MIWAPFIRFLGVPPSFLEVARRRYDRVLSIRSAPTRLKGLRDLPVACCGLPAPALGATLSSLTRRWGKGFKVKGFKVKGFKVKG